MKTTTTFTSTMSPDLIRWVDSLARAKKKTRRSVLEDAIKLYKRQLTQEHLRKGFERAANDPEILELVEWGMGDYARMLSSLDS